MDEGASDDGGLDDGSNGRLLNIGQHPGHHVAAALEQAQDRRLLLLQRAAPGRGSQPAAPTGTPLSAPAAGWPLCPAPTRASAVSAPPRRPTGGRLAARPSPRAR